jgi:hypothetical protein
LQATPQAEALSRPGKQTWQANLASKPGKPTRQVTRQVNPASYFSKPTRQASLTAQINSPLRCSALVFWEIGRKAYPVSVSRLLFGPFRVSNRSATITSARVLWHIFT